MTSARFSGFWTPSPPCPHFAQIYSSKSTQPPLLCLLLGYPPPPPPGVDVLYVWPLSRILPPARKYQNFGLVLFIKADNFDGGDTKCAAALD